jgi:hypothetical protein
VLAPATRFGYFIYPAALLIWLEVSLLAEDGSAALAEDVPAAGAAGPEPEPEPAEPPGRPMAGSAPMAGPMAGSAESAR